MAGGGFLSVSWDVCDDVGLKAGELKRFVTVSVDEGNE